MRNLGRHQLTVEPGKLNSQYAAEFLPSLLRTVVDSGCVGTIDQALTNLSKNIVYALFRVAVPATIEELFTGDAVSLAIGRAIILPDYNLITLVCARWVVTCPDWPATHAFPYRQEQLEAYLLRLLKPAEVAELHKIADLDRWEFDVKMEDGLLAAVCRTKMQEPEPAPFGLDASTEDTLDEGETAPTLTDDENGRRWAIPTEMSLDTDLSDAPLGAVVQAVLPTVCTAFIRVVEAGGTVDVTPLNVLLNLGRECVGAAFALRAEAQGITLQREDVDAWFWTGDGLTITTSCAKFLAYCDRFPEIEGFPVTQDDLRVAFDKDFGDVPPSRFLDVENLSFSVVASLPDGAAPRCRFFTGGGQSTRPNRTRRATRRGRK